MSKIEPLGATPFDSMWHLIGQVGRLFPRGYGMHLAQASTMDISVSTCRSTPQSSPVMPRTYPHHLRRLQAPRHPYRGRSRYPTLLLVFPGCSEGGALRVAVHRDFERGPTAIGTGCIARIQAKSPYEPVGYVVAWG